MEAWSFGEGVVIGIATAGLIFAVFVAGLQVGADYERAHPRKKDGE